MSTQLLLKLYRVAGLTDDGDVTAEVIVYATSEDEARTAARGTLPFGEPLDILSVELVAFEPGVVCVALT